MDRAQERDREIRAKGIRSSMATGEILWSHGTICAGCGERTVFSGTRICYDQDRFQYRTVSDPVRLCDC